MKIGKHDVSDRFDLSLSELLVGTALLHVLTMTIVARNVGVMHVEMDDTRIQNARLPVNGV
jgi:hypothetical protein